MRSISHRQKLLIGYAVLALIGATLIDRHAVETIHGIAVRAATAFAISKSINAALSFAQEASVSGGLLVSGSIHPAAFLDPVDDLVEQFASVMLAVSVAAALIEVSLRIGGSWVMMALLVASIAVVWHEPSESWPRRVPEPARRLARGGLLLASLGLIGLPAAVSLTDLASARFLESRYVEAESGLLSVKAQAEEITEGAEAATDPEEDAEAGLFDSLRRAGGGALDSMRMTANGFSSLFSNIVTMITVFALQTVILPLGLAWLAYRCAGVAFRLVFPDRPETRR